MGSILSSVENLVGGGGSSNSAGNSNSSAAGILQNTLGTAATSKNPDWEQQASQDAYTMGANAASQPYTPYTGQLVAGKTNNQQTASQLANAAPGRYASTYGQTQSDLNSSATPYTQTYQAQNVTPQQNNQTISTLPGWNASTAQQYMNPYTQATLQPQLTDLNNAFAQQQNQLNGNAASAGAFGGSRQALLNTQLANQQDEQTENLTNTANSTAYNTGLTAYQNAQSNNLAAQTEQANVNQNNNALNLQGQLANQQEGLNAYNANYNVANGNRTAALNAASGENSLVNTQQNATNSIIGNLASTGQTSQTTNQNQDTANYQQYENQLYYPEQQASYLTNLLKSNPSTGSLTSAGNNGVSGLGSLLNSGLNSLTGSGGTGSGGGLSSLGSLSSLSSFFGSSGAADGAGDALDAIGDALAVF